MEHLLSLHSILYLFFLPSLSLYLLFFFFAPKSQTHGFKSYPIVGHLPSFVLNRHRLLDWITDGLATAPTATFSFRRLGGPHFIVTADPTNVEHILRSRFGNYPKGPRFTGILEDLFGRGIFNVDGDHWRTQRKAASIELGTASFRNFHLETVRRSIVSALLPLLEKAAADGSILDLQEAFEQNAFVIVCKVALGVDPPSDGVLAKAFTDATDLISGRFRYTLQGLWKVKRLFNVGSERRLKESIAIVNVFALKVIRSRMAEISSSDSFPAEDLLSQFIVTKSNSEEFLRDIIVTFILAGLQTTSSVLAWLFWLLSSRQETKRRIVEEIQSVRHRSGYTSGGAFCFDELREMQYLHAAITEAMRLYPPVPVNSVACKEDDVLPDGTEVRKGWLVSYYAYAMGRMERVWGEDCRDYRPERWMDEGRGFRPESPFRFPAFHGGARMCLGKEMAYVQMKLVVASMMERFEIEVVGNKLMELPEVMLSLTLRMKGGLPVRVKERQLVRSG